MDPPSEPTLAEKLAELLEGSSKCCGKLCTDNTWDIQHFGPTRPGFIHPWRIIDLEIKECACGSWADQAFPCIHAVRAATLQGMPLSELYDAATLSIAHFRKTYSFAFRPWPTDIGHILSTDITVIVPTVEAPPAEQGKRGRSPRPKRSHKRRKSKNCT